MQFLSTETRIRVLVADSGAVNCEFLAAVLSQDSRFEIDCATTASAALEALDRQEFHLFLLGGSIGDGEKKPFQIVREAREAYPNLGIIVLLDSTDRRRVVEAFRAGAYGVVSRKDSFSDLCKCIACVHQGQTWANSEQLLFLVEALADGSPIQDSSVTGTRCLSRREEEIAKLAAKGMSNRQISDRLNLSEHTVKNYMFRIFEKLGVATRVELTLYALKQPMPPRGKLRFPLPPVEDTEPTSPN